MSLTEQDKQELEYLEFNARDIQDDHYDYSKVVVDRRSDVLYRHEFELSLRYICKRNDNFA
jgi:hypothetical protein